MDCDRSPTYALTAEVLQQQQAQRSRSLCSGSSLSSASSAEAVLDMSSSMPADQHLRSHTAPPAANHSLMVSCCLTTHTSCVSAAITHHSMYAMCNCNACKCNCMQAKAWCRLGIKCTCRSDQQIKLWAKRVQAAGSKAYGSDILHNYCWRPPFLLNCHLRLLHLCRLAPYPAALQQQALQATPTTQPACA
jgi:hypothetical protein